MMASRQHSVHNSFIQGTNKVQQQSHAEHQSQHACVLSLCMLGGGRAGMGGGGGGGVADLLKLLTIVAAIITGGVQLGGYEAVPFLYPPASPPGVPPHC